MTKLYGTADSALVSAAFRHGQSMVPGDMKGVYKWQVENFAKFSASISKMFDKIYADNKNTMDLLNDNATKAIDILEAGGMPNDWGIEMHSDIINDYKSRLKAIPKGKKGDLERSKLRSEMNRYLLNIESGENMFVDMISNAANSRLLNDLGDDKAKLFNLMVEDHNNGTSITKPSYENGEIVYSVPGSDIKLSMREINEGMSAHDPKYLSGIQQKLTSFQTRGKAMGGAMTVDDALRFKNELQTSITSWDEIRNVSQEKFGKMKFTFEQVLTGQAKDANGNLDTDLLSHIYEELEALGGIDIDDDGDIDDTDKSLLAQARKNGDIYTGAKASDNGFILIDALKKDKQKYRDVLANYLTETAVKDVYGQGAAQFKGKKAKNPNNPNAPLFTPNTWVPLGLQGKSITSAQATGIVDDIENGRSFPFENEQYDYVNGGWYQNYENGDNEQSDNYYGDPEVLRLNIFGSGGNDSRFKNLVTEKVDKMDAASGEALDSKKQSDKTTHSAINKAFDVTMMKSDDNAIAANLQKLMKAPFQEGNLEGYSFKTFQNPNIGGGDFTKEAVGLYDDDNNIVRYPEGHAKAGDKVQIKTGGNLARRKKAIQTIDDILATFGYEKYFDDSSNPTVGMTPPQIIQYYINNPR